MGTGQRHVQEKGTEEGLLTGGWQLKGGRGWGQQGVEIRKKDSLWNQRKVRLEKETYSLKKNT